MLLIHCPYCDETLPEVEFTYAGQAHVVRRRLGDVLQVLEAAQHGVDGQADVVGRQMAMASCKPVSGFAVILMVPAGIPRSR